MNLHHHAAQSMRHFGPRRHPADSVPGLPSVPGGRNPQRGSTRTFLDPSRRPAVIDVEAQPTLKIVPQSDGGVQVVLKRNARSAEFMTEAEHAILRDIMRDIKREAVSLSQGPLSLKELRRRGHPYGRGLKRGKVRGRIARSGRAGVPSLGIVNKQSGNFAQLWSTDIKKGKTGADFILSNEAPYARFLAEGTNRMRAHGGFTIAFIKHLRRLDTEWRKAAKAARLRETIVEQHS